MTTRLDVANMMDAVFAECHQLRKAGQQEYAHDDDNALGNFERAAADLGLTREQVLWIFTKKHLDGILAYINGHRSQRESVTGRINDVIVYLILLRCMAAQELTVEAA